MEVIYLKEKTFDPDEKVKDREEKIEEFKEESGIDINASQPEIEFEVCKKFPLNFRLSEFICEDLMNHRKRRIIKDTAALFPQRSLRDVIGNAVISHSELWKINGFQENARAIAYLKGLLLAHFGMLDDFVNQPRLRSHKSTLRTLEPSGSPLSVHDTSLQKIKSTMVPEVKFSKTKLNFGQISTFSGQSAPLGNTSITKGNLQCLLKSGMPYFIFLVDDAPQPQVIYMASPQKIESSSVKAIHNMYSFYSISSKSNCRSHCSNQMNLIAQMKVSSSMVLKPNCVKAMETEFVLYDSHERLSNELQNSSSVLSRSKGFPKKIKEILRRRSMRNRKSFNKENGQKLHRLVDNNVSSIVNYSVNSLLPNLELAAIVVEECLQDTTNDSVFGGWGLKFLEKASEKAVSSATLCCSENSDGFGRIMDVLIPAGPHGGPLTRNGGKSSLVGRWRSGGHCDCGGWDLGCPLTVLNYSSICSNASPKDIEKRPLNLFMEGTRSSGHPTLSMLKVREGFYSIHFRSSLSVLQSFSIAVAAIHTKIANVVPNPNFE
ncbi:hypothetical protein KSP39_PZI004270 [Platanthera zijinensis]|uniref:Uncharacterized protein n=1 Tax=Platanthera zijinensis TaxID=2320716 RepID=A0AAP0BVV0_9ASPA